MADEHVLIYETEAAIPFTCADAVGIEKGTLLYMFDPATVSGALTTKSVVGGVAKTEKIASDGKTKISVYRGGIFRAKASGSITCGDPLEIAGGTGTCNNLLQTAAINTESIVGISLETAANGETFRYELRPTAMQLA
jgi:hypothetical protein